MKGFKDSSLMSFISNNSELYVFLYIFIIFLLVILEVKGNPQNWKRKQLVTPMLIYGTLSRICAFVFSVIQQVIQQKCNAHTPHTPTFPLSHPYTLYSHLHYSFTIPTSYKYYTTYYITIYT